MDNGKVVAFDATEMRHFDHGYAVTCHSSQGLTAERVLVNIDTKSIPSLLIAALPMCPSRAPRTTRRFILIPRLRSRGI